MPRAFAMWLRPGGDELTEEGLKAGYIFIGWDTQPSHDGMSDEDLLRTLRRHYRNEAQPGYVANQMFTFLRRMSRGDLVLVPVYRRDRCYAAKILGEVEKCRIGSRRMYCRPVKWLNFKSPWKKTELPSRLRESLKRRQTVWEI
jgi:predicted Mrr-cat superfamily restriction endonuclease